MLALFTRGRTLAVALTLLTAVQGGIGTAWAARTPLVVRRLSLPPRTAEGSSDRSAATARRDRPVPRMRAVPPSPLSPAGPGAGPEAWRAELDARNARDRAFPHLISPPGFDWSPRANSRFARHHLPAQRNPHTREASVPMAATAARIYRVAYIRIEFEHDRGGDLSTGDGRFDLSGPDMAVAPIDRPPHNRTFYESHIEALRRYYDVQSYGGVAIQGDVWPRTENGAYRLNDLGDFGPWAFSFDIYGAARDLFRAQVFAADSQSVVDYHDRIPWDSYDAFVFIHAGSDLQSDLKQDSPEDIPTFTIGVADEDTVSLPGMAYGVKSTIMMPETVSQDGFYGALNGVFAHEHGHLLFGFFDLYDVFTGRPVVGFWSLMDSGNLVGAPFLLPDGSESFAVGLLPPSVDPFHRFFMPSPLVFNDAVPGDTVVVHDIERNPDVRRVFLSSDEYLLIENRAIAATDSVPLDQDSVTRVVLGPKYPDRYEYDGLLPSLPHEKGTPPLASGGLLIWRIDASRIPFETATRIGPNDYGFNTDPLHPAISVLEADGLADLGDGSSPFLFGSAYDPYFLSNNRLLSDTTVPSLKPSTGTNPHTLIRILDDPGLTMRMSTEQDWRLKGWPVTADMPDQGPELLAVDADGAPDRHLEVCWAGGGAGSPDSTGVFAVRLDGRGMFGGPHVFASLDRRPRPLMAALATGDALADPPDGPSWFAVTTYYDLSADTLGGSPGGQAWLLDHLGAPRPGWPAVLPSPVSTPPVISGLYPNATVFVGCDNGYVYELGLNGAVRTRYGAGLPGGISGRLAVWRDPNTGYHWVAAGAGAGAIAVYSDSPVPGGSPGGLPGWPRQVAGAGFDPDFLWIDFDGNGRPAGEEPTCGSGVPALIAHHADHLWAFCSSGEELPGWSGARGDTVVTGLGAGDPDADGYAEVLIEMRHGQIAFLNQGGSPSPGWPRQASREVFRTDSPPLTFDVDGDGIPEVVALDGSGALAAVSRDGHLPSGWPLATGARAAGAPLIADLDRDGRMEVVAPDRVVKDSPPPDLNGRFGSLWAYSLPALRPGPGGVVWPMSGGDPGRTAALAGSRGPTAPPAVAGPLVEGSLRAYPNPARRHPVSFAYQLSEPADVDFSIIDPSGHEVASFTRSGRRADNLEVWDPGRVPAGLYVARLRFRGAGSTHSEAITLGLLR